MSRFVFDLLRQATLQDWPLEDLAVLTTHLSILRRDAGAPLRGDILVYVAEVNAVMTTRAREREATLLSDPIRAASRQSVGLEGIESDGRLDRAVEEATRTAVGRGGR